MIVKHYVKEMDMAQIRRFESLNKDNYDTWKMFMEALLVKNDLWQYVNGTSVKPEATVGDAASESATKAWEQNDAKARSDIILSISSPELKQVKGCVTSREVWKKLQDTYQSKGPARKAALLRQLTTLKMQGNTDVRTHLNLFFDTVDKINEIGVEIDGDLLSTLLLISLPSDFENFRCAVEARDALPTLDTLRVKIVEEADARKGIASNNTSNAMYAKKQYKKLQKKPKDSNENSSNGTFKYKCHKCKLVGHKAIDCKSQKKEPEVAQNTTDTTMFTSQANLVSTTATSKWCLDSGATSHFCYEARKFDINMCVKDEKLNLANKDSTKIRGQGTARLNTNVYGESRSICLENTQLVPDLRMNLLSVSKITEHGFDVIFDREKGLVLDQDGNVKLIANKINGLYVVEDSVDSIAVAEEVCNNCTSKSKIDWHQRFGHLNAKDLQEAISRGRVEGVKLGSFTDDDCSICVEGKMARSPFPIKSVRSTNTLDLVHTDLCGPMRVESIGGAKYILQFIDDSSRWGQVYFLKCKSEVFQALKSFVTMMENQIGRKVKCIQSDNGKEFVNTSIDEFLKERGIIRRLTVPYCPQQNGVAERRNRTLVEMARCLLLQSGLPQRFWAEAVNTANHIRNRCPSKSINGRTPFEMLTGNTPDVKYFREFGQHVFILNKGPGIGKFDSRGKAGIFVGYSDTSKGYRIWIPEEMKIVVSRDVKFLHTESPMRTPHEDFCPEVQKNSDTNSTNQNAEHEFADIELESPSDSTNSSNDVIVNCTPEAPAEERDELAAEDAREIPPENQEDAPPGNLEEEDRRRAPGRPKVIRTGERGRPRKEYHYHPQRTAFLEEEVAHLAEVPMKQAMSSPEANEWRAAMIEELRSIIKNNTWKLVDRVDNETIIGSRMVLRNKVNADGSMQRRKARLVAQGFTQRPGVHFNETFAPVARIGSIRTMVSLAAHYGMKIHQLDVTTAFLNGRLEEDILMEPPKELPELLKAIADSKKDDIVRKKAEVMLNEFNAGDKVCKLEKALYGLRQAGRSWHHTFDKTLKEYGAIATNADTCLYHIGQGEDATLIAIYVDDVLIASRNEKDIERISDFLSQRFNIKRLGEVHQCLGIEFNRDGNSISMNQRGYINEVLRRFGMDDCNPVSTPFDPSVKLEKGIDKSSKRELDLPYREIMGCLTYIASSTRPDIAFSASYLGQFNNCYDESHWKAAKRVLRYLKGTQDIGLIYRPDSKPLIGYTDSDWGSCQVDRRSHSGFVFILSGCPVTWDAKKQKTVALSTCEAEYMALAEVAKEAVFLQRFLRELGFNDLSDITVYGDNLGAIKLASNPVFHQRSKHIDIKYHYVRDALRDEDIKIKHVPTADMIADILTKGLPRKKHTDCLKKAGMRSLYSRV